MSQENVETLNRAYDALRRRNKEAFVREIHPEVESVVYIMQAEGRVYRGHAGVRRFFDDLFSVFPDFRAEVAHATDYGDIVLAEIRMAGRGAGSGLPIEQTAWQVVGFRDAEVISFHGYRSREEALEAVGLRE